MCIVFNATLSVAVFWFKMGNYKIGSFPFLLVKFETMKLCFVLYVLCLRVYNGAQVTICIL